jgi:hypothetical protein
MRKKEKSNVTAVRPGLSSRVRFAAGLCGLGGVGLCLGAVGPAAGYIAGLLLLLANVFLFWATIFSSREEPNKRLARLIRALRGKRGR